MSAIFLTKQALSVLSREKPHSSITDLVEILTSLDYEDEAYDGIPELVESINLQPTGPAEASRAIRKKLKHGNAHQQYRALVLLKATVENAGHKFQTTFADGQLTDAIKHLASDPGTDPKVKKKLISVLGSWHRQFQGDPSMSLVANLYKSVPHSAPVSHARVVQPGIVEQETDWERKRREEREAKEEAKKKAKEAKEAAKAEEKRKKDEELKQKAAKDKRKRPPFDFEKEKPTILQTIAETSQAANNLVNAMTLVNPDHESVQENARVAECLEKAKQTRKRVVRYIQLVENEEFIGTLIETNERVIAALQMYDKMIKPVMTKDDVEAIQQHIAKVRVNNTGGEVERLQEKQRAAIDREISRGKDNDKDKDKERDQYGTPPNSAGLHPDLQDLSFGEVGSIQGGLPPPLRPDADSSDDDHYDARGSLSDFSDYESSDEETHNKRASSSQQKSNAYASSSTAKNYANISDDGIDARRDPKKGLLHEEEDPFADPFADQSEVGSIVSTNRRDHW